MRVGHKDEMKFTEVDLDEESITVGKTKVPKILSSQDSLDIIEVQDLVFTYSTEEDQMERCLIKD